MKRILGHIGWTCLSLLVAAYLSIYFVLKGARLLDEDTTAETWITKNWLYRWWFPQ